MAALALAACGGSGKQVPLAPLPDDPKPAVEEPKAPPAPVAEEAPAPPPAPTGPIEVAITKQETTVKLLGKGKGKLAPLRYAGKAGGKQPVELALDFSSKEQLDADQNETVLPTIVLIGEAETKAVDKDGRADYAIAIAGTDARDMAGSRVRTADLKVMLGSLVGLVIGGSLAANGAAGDVTLRVEKPDHLTVGALEMVRLTLPVLPVLPAEAIGVGAKWQTTTTRKLADKIVVKQVTDYELVEAKGDTWSVKGKTVVSGADQELQGSKISNIRGSGESTLTISAAGLYPTYKSQLETQFTASEQGAQLNLALRVAATVTAK